MADVVDVLLIGGGVAAASVASELRQQGFAGSVTLATREQHAPYHRPPISKELLAYGAVDTAVHPEDWWGRQDIELLTRSAVASLDLATRTATLTSRREISFRSAVVATGAMVRRLQIDEADLGGIHYLRTPANAARLKLESDGAEQIAIVGGSFVATEVAASLSARGARCTMIMQESGPLVRTVGKTASDYVTRWLIGRGVEIVPNCDVTAFVGADGHVRGVRTADGREIHSDLVVVGVGAIPDVRLSERAGLEIGVTGGVRCDSRLETNVRGVYAAGDMCEYDSVIHQRRIRVEHEQHAVAQGVTVARNLLGADEPHTAVPYFWTDLIGLGKLEYVGAGGGWTDEVVTGLVEDHEFTVWHMNEDRVVAALTLGRPEDLDRARDAIVNQTAQPGRKH